MSQAGRSRIHIATACSSLAGETRHIPRHDCSEPNLIASHPPGEFNSNVIVHYTYSYLSFHRSAVKLTSTELGKVCIQPTGLRIGLRIDLRSPELNAALDERTHDAVATQLLARRAPRTQHQIHRGPLVQARGNDGDTSPSICSGRPAPARALWRSPWALRRCARARASTWPRWRRWWTRCAAPSARAG